MERKKIYNNILIDTFEEVSNKKLADLVDTESKEELNGIIVKGYEMIFSNGANENGERYDVNAFDKFINRYFVNNSLNIPITLMHGNRFEDICGKVLKCEVSEKGLYFIAYIPDYVVNYNAIKNYLKDGLLQGFSKEGWATDYEIGKDGVMVINEFELLNISLVSTPANGLNFESLQITNATKFENKINSNTTSGNNQWDDIDEFFV